MRIHTVRAQRPTPETFQRFGILSSLPTGEPSWGASGSRVDGVREGVQHEKKKVSDLWALGDLEFEESPYLAYVRYLNQGYRVAQLERHMKETQTWVACKGTSIFVVAPRGDDPAPETAEAFLFEPGDVVAFGKGIWQCHFLPLVDEAEFIAVTARKMPEQDRDLVNFASRGVVLQIALEGA